MGLYKTEALVLSSWKYREADSFLTLLTKKKGKVKALAKGVRKPQSRLRGGVQLFTHNEMLFYQGRSLAIVTQSECLEAFVPLQQNMVALATACYWSELWQAFLPWEEEDDLLFTLALAGFHLLALENSELVVRGLECKLLDALGYRPVLEHCVACRREIGREKALFFSVDLGGILCGSCQKRKQRNCNGEVLKIWQQLQQMPLSKLSRLKISRSGLQILGCLLDEFILYQLDYPLKSRGILEDIWQVAQN